MSQSFRAVKELRNAAFVLLHRTEKLIVLLHDLATSLGPASDEHGYGDNQVVWLENSGKVLDYMEAHRTLQCGQFQRQYGRTRDRC